MKRTAIVGLLALASWSAQAAHDVPGWRVGAAATFNDFEWSAGGIDASDNSVGGKLYTQYQFNDWFGVEAAYHNTGDFSADVVTSTDPAFPSGSYDLSFSGFSGALIGYVPITSDEVQFYGKVGYFDFDDELSFNGSVSSSGSESGLMAGAGALIEISDHFGVRADADWFDTEVGDLWAVNIGIEYFFGGHKEAAPVAAVAAPMAVAAAVEPPPPADADGDGVVDGGDQCPDTPRGDRVGPYGCSCDVTRQVEFSTDSAALTDTDKATLDELADSLLRLKFVAGTVDGHTDSDGEADYNLALSERRAQAVADYLQAKGVGQGRLAVKGFGETMPVGDNATAEGRAQNRRVVLRRTDCDAGR